MKIRTKVIIFAILIGLVPLLVSQYLLISILQERLVQVTDPVDLEYHRGILDDVVALGGFSALFFVLLVVLAGLVISNSIIAPVEKLTSSVDEISKGNLNVELEESLKESHDEIGELARAFDRTLVSLKLAMKQSAPELKKQSEELKAALREKAEAEEKYRGLMQVSPDAIAVIDLKGNFTYVSDRMLELLGYNKAEEIVGRNALELVPPRDQEGVRRGIGKMLKGSELALTSQQRFLRKDGSIVTLDLKAVTLHDREGKPSGSMAIFRDVQELGEKESRLIESKKRFEAFMDNSPFVAWIKDEKGEYLYVNRRWEDMFGKALSELLGRTDFDIFPEGVARKLRVDDEAVRYSGKTLQFDESVPLPGDYRAQWKVYKFALKEGLVGGIAIEVHGFKGAGPQGGKTPRKNRAKKENARAPKS